MKKAIIYMSKLSIGGMEKALVDLIKKSDLTKYYDVDLILVYNYDNFYINQIKDKVNVKVLWKNKLNIAGKIVAFIKLSLLKIKNIFKKYDLSICYAHHHGILASLARTASKNNVIFVHTDLIKSRSPKVLKKLMRKVKFEKFKNIICVSNCAKVSFLKIYPNFKGKIIVANNYIDGDNILEKSKEKINDYKFDKNITFINVARHVDFHKKISEIIMAATKLKDKYKFKVILLGDGPDHKKYQELIKENKLEDIVYLLGNKSNPYKYMKNSSALVFSSDFEGYGIVLDEARVLNLPIITKDVADAKTIISEGYGILCNNIYLGMKEFLEKKYTIKKEFDYNEFNNNITKSLNQIFGGENE